MRGAGMAEALLLRAEGLCLRTGSAPFDAELRPGEIIGLAGLDGHGQDIFLEVAAGLRRPAAGRVVVEGKGTVHGLEDLRHAASLGIAYLPRDRRTTGIFPTLSVLDNFAIASIGRDVRAFLIDRRARRRRYQAFADRLSIRLICQPCSNKVAITTHNVMSKEPETTTREGHHHSAASAGPPNIITINSVRRE